MTSKIKEVIRDIKLYELGIKDKLDGYDELMNLRDFNSLNPKELPDETHYGKSINGIKSKCYSINPEHIRIRYRLSESIEDLFELSYSETRELLIKLAHGAQS